MKKILLNSLLGTVIGLSISSMAIANGPGTSDLAGVNSKPLQDSTNMNKKSGKMKSKSGGNWGDSTGKGMQHDKSMKTGKKGMKSGMDSTTVK